MAGSQESDSLTTAPQLVSDLADACVRYVERALSRTLDFTQDTLPLLDHYLSDAEALEGEVLGLVAPACGAYFGEVVRRHLGEGTWECPEGDYASWALVLPSAGIRFNPIGVAIEVISGEDAEGWSAHFTVPPDDRALARDAVDRLGEVSPDDYYTFAVRFDVLAQVHGALRRAQT